MGAALTKFYSVVVLLLLLAVLLLLLQRPTVVGRQAGVQCVAAVCVDICRMGAAEG